MFFRNFERPFILEHGAYSHQTFGKRVSGDSLRFIFQRRKICFDNKFGLKSLFFAIFTAGAVEGPWLRPGCRLCSIVAPAGRAPPRQPQKLKIREIGVQTSGRSSERPGVRTSERPGVRTSEQNALLKISDNHNLERGISRSRAPARAQVRAHALARVHERAHSDETQYLTRGSRKIQK